MIKSMQGRMAKNKIKPEWSPNFAYAMGLLATDGCMYNDGRHFDLTSKDIEQLKNFMKCLNFRVKIGKKVSGYTGKKQLTFNLEV